MDDESNQVCYNIPTHTIYTSKPSFHTFSMPFILHNICTLSQGTQGTRGQPEWGAYPIAGQQHVTDNLKMPVSQQCICLDWRKKPENLEETPKADSTHTGGI